MSRRAEEMHRREPRPSAEDNGFAGGRIDVGSSTGGTRSGNTGCPPPAADRSAVDGLQTVSGNADPAEREQFITAAEQRPLSGILHDPIEDDPAVRPLFLAIQEEATREVNEWHRDRVAGLERESPAVADLFRSGRGLCHRIWSRVKELLQERHGVAWRSPREMNPWMMFA